MDRTIWRVLIGRGCVGLKYWKSGRGGGEERGSDMEVTRHTLYGVTREDE